MPEVSAAERRAETVTLLREQGHVSVSKLSNRFGVSEVTIRKDLGSLEDANVAVRTHGGAILAEHFQHDLPFDKFAIHHADEKRRIGAIAAGLVENGDTVVMAAGTTTAQVAYQLSDKRNLTVLTNSLHVANALTGQLEVDVLLLGGQLRHTTAALIGPYAEHMLQQHAVRRAILGADGYDPSFGLTTTGMMEAHLYRLMIEAADEVIVVADSAKFSHRGLQRICGPEAIDVFISDDGISDEMQEHLSTHDIQVLIA